MLGIATERIAAMQRATYDDSPYVLSTANASNIELQASGLFNIYWMLVDLLGYSNESFKHNLVMKTLEYTFKDKEVPANV
jgi:hypothetical protein